MAERSGVKNQDLPDFLQRQSPPNRGVLDVWKPKCANKPEQSDGGG